MGELPDIIDAVSPHLAIRSHLAATYNRSRSRPQVAAAPKWLAEALAREGIASCAAATQHRNGVCARVAGVAFATIEDETGIANVVIWPAVIEKYRRAVVGAALLLVHGRIQRAERGIVHLLAERLEDRSAALRSLDAAGLVPPLARADEVARPQLPRNRPGRGEGEVPLPRDFR